MSRTQPIRIMTSDDLGMVLAWRNHSDVRRYMYAQHEISLVEHTNWFERVKNDPKRHLLIYQHGTLPLGFINIHQISDGGIADWGFYVKPSAPQGTGTELGKAALEHAFTKLLLHKLCGQALAFNERSIKFHQKLGFAHEGTLADQHFDGHKYHSVWCFGLIASQWQAINHGR